MIFGKKWKAQTFFIASIEEGTSGKDGYTYKEMGLFLMGNNDWSLTHLGTGHRVLILKGTLKRVQKIGKELADSADWNFCILPSIANPVSDMLKAKVMAIVKKYPQEARRGAHTQADQIVASAAGAMNRGL